MSENQPIWNRPAEQPPPGGPDQQPPQPPRRAWPRRHKTLTILLALPVLIIAIVVIALVGSGDNKAAPTATHPAATSPSPSASVLNAAEQTFVDDMRSKYDFTSNVKDSDIAQFGQQICTERQAGGTQASEYTTAKESWSQPAARTPTTWCASRRLTCAPRTCLLSGGT